MVCWRLSQAIRIDLTVSTNQIKSGPGCLNPMSRFSRTTAKFSVKNQIIGSLFTFSVVLLYVMVSTCHYVDWVLFHGFTMLTGFTMLIGCCFIGNKFMENK